MRQPVSSPWRSRASFWCEGLLLRAARTAPRIGARCRPTFRPRPPAPGHTTTRRLGSGAAGRHSARTGTAPTRLHHRTYWRTGAPPGVPTPPGATTHTCSSVATGDGGSHACEPRHGPRPSSIHERRSPHRACRSTHTGARRAPGDALRSSPPARAVGCGHGARRRAAVRADAPNVSCPAARSCARTATSKASPCSREASQALLRAPRHETRVPPSRPATP